MIVIDAKKLEDGNYKVMVREYYYAQVVRSLDNEVIVSPEEFAKLQEKNNKSLEDL